MDLLWYCLYLSITSGFNSSLSLFCMVDIVSTSDDMLPVGTFFQDAVKRIHEKRKNWVNVEFCDWLKKAICISL